LKADGEGEKDMQIKKMKESSKSHSWIGSKSKKSRTLGYAPDAYTPAIESGLDNVASLSGGSEGLLPPSCWNPNSGENR